MYTQAFSTSTMHIARFSPVRGNLTERRHVFLSYYKLVQYRDHRTSTNDSFYNIPMEPIHESRRIALLTVALVLRHNNCVSWASQYDSHVIKHASWTSRRFSVRQLTTGFACTFANTHVLSTALVHLHVLSNSFLWLPGIPSFTFYHFATLSSVSAIPCSAHLRHSAKLGVNGQHFLRSVDTCCSNSTTGRTSPPQQNPHCDF